ncbi:hypothetical protein MTR67_024242 [Solanum verrucosum]|uniref:Aminotransferase-like plant mobile domain-containing protein n=1 Tax=Solanum verrucosum TaxID=315347 RepID=A0AAF0QYG3_SOLVR|nr:hypothetical protein MTR67_024242 [Solanum verrucosum]
MRLLDSYHYFRGPHVARWFTHFSWTNTIKHGLRVFRDALDSMTEDQFIWEPYSSDIIESLPEYCRFGRDIWHAKVPIFVGMLWRFIYPIEL